MPASVAVPSPLSVKLIPAGNVDPEDKLRAGVGAPVLVTGQLKAEPAGTVSLAPLVICGASGLTMSAVVMPAVVSITQDRLAARPLARLMVK